MLLETQGTDANHSAQKVELIRKTIAEGHDPPAPPSGPAGPGGPSGPQ
jgi:hypothetical protein